MNKNISKKEFYLLNELRNLFLSFCIPCNLQAVDAQEPVDFNGSIKSV